MYVSNFRGDCHTLWEGGGSVLKYLPLVNLKAMGISCNCWEDIWYAIRWSRQPSDKPPEMSSERFWWLLVDNFITNFNVHNFSTFYPGVELEADKPMVPWYGHGVNHINIGLPHYVVMDRKFNIGGKIKINIKQCNAAFLKTYLDTLILSKHGDCHVLASISKDTARTKLVAMTWLDCNR